jgi:hypothetical protein
MKIIGVGLNKTGTKSLGASLKKLGFRHLEWSPEAFSLYRAHGFAGLLDILDRYDSFEDWPWPLVYRDIDSALPGCKYILTLRNSAETWYRSLCKHAGRTGPTPIREYVYGYAMPDENRQAHIDYYETHNAAVRDYFRERPDDLVEVCWENGDGWREIAAFLGMHAPDSPFPHENRSPE